jgi:predicted nicotinamide N-methyase
MTILSADDSQAVQHIQLSIQQKQFSAEGFASTVWDSSIVTAKYVEKWPHIFTGKRCLDLSAGCGLVGQCWLGTRNS